MVRFLNATIFKQSLCILIFTKSAIKIYREKFLFGNSGIQKGYQWNPVYVDIFKTE